MATGFIVAAPASGSGKTTLTLGLLRHFRNAGVAVAAFKVGPDFIDPAFHEAASGRQCYNLDVWAMREETVGAVIDAACEGAELVIGEGAMGLFDNLTDKDLEAIRRFIEEIDVDVTNEDLRELVEKHWPWLLPKLSPPTQQ